RNWLACTKAIEDIHRPVRVYPLNHMRIIKDLVVDLEDVWAQYALIEPWLKTESPAPERERLQSPEQRAELKAGGDGGLARHHDEHFLFGCTSPARP
ncbi:MAG: 2Fe-2S iron-sulfur cluster-binding protein, partial [Geminicoccaceae bacterium]